jgi:hypothetical protein
MEPGQPQTGWRPSPKAMKRAFKITLRHFIGFLALNMMWFAWRTYWEVFVTEVLLEIGFRTAEVPPLSQEEKQVMQAGF